MPYELQDLAGYLFPNDYGKDNPKAPRARGSHMGVCSKCGHREPQEIAVWAKPPDKKGSFYKIQPKRERQEQAPQQYPEQDESWL